MAVAPCPLHSLLVRSKPSNATPPQPTHPCIPSPHLCDLHVVRQDGVQRLLPALGSDQHGRGLVVLTVLRKEVSAARHQARVRPGLQRVSDLLQHVVQTALKAHVHRAAQPACLLVQLSRLLKLALQVSAGRAWVGAGAAEELSVDCQLGACSLVQHPCWIPRQPSFGQLQSTQASGSTACLLSLLTQAEAAAKQAQQHCHPPATHLISQVVRRLQLHLRRAPQRQCQQLLVQLLLPGQAGAVGGAAGEAEGEAGSGTG